VGDLAAFRGGVSPVQRSDCDGIGRPWALGLDVMGFTTARIMHHRQRLHKVASVLREFSATWTSARPARHGTRHGEMGSAFSRRQKPSLSATQRLQAASRSKMAINWFPGHMNKARREIAEVMPKVDLIIEVLDARIPFSSENPLVSELRGNTPCLKLLNKSDLADPLVTAEWIAHFEAEDGISAMTCHREDPKKTLGLLKQSEAIVGPERAKRKPILVMILGIPNVGKSTLINTLCRRKIAKTANVPAVTKQQQQIRVSKNFFLLDTPGFLWPKLSPEACGYRLAVTGAIKDAVIDYLDIALFAAKYLLEHYPAALQARYDLSEIPPSAEALLDAIAERRGCIGRNGAANLNKVSEILIHEFRQGTLGPLSLETPKMCIEVQA
jgi:ribosome biogenesis GTPase A